VSAPTPAAAAPRTADRGLRGGFGEGNANGNGRWHYRRSLASRVTLLTTIAVGLAVAFVAAGAYFTVRMQLQSALDNSLLQRARAASPVLCDPNVKVPREYLGTANTWVICATDSGVQVARYIDQIPPRLGDPSRRWSPASASRRSGRSPATTATRCGGSSRCTARTATR
jgi:hypothetical protein